MAIVKILQYPDSRLSQCGETVTAIDAEIQQVIDDMFETHYNAHNCAALAATQLDFKQPKRITVIDFSENKDQPLCLINPEIIDSHGEQFEHEGCMSVGVVAENTSAAVYARVKRAMTITVRALDREGKPLEFEATGFMAKCIQHELDHLDGKLFIDHLSAFKRKRLLDRLKKVRGQHAKQKKVE